MEPIKLSRPEGKAFVSLHNEDLTEGRGAHRARLISKNQDVAEVAAYGSDVQGSDGSVVKVRTNVIFPGIPMFSNTAGAIKTFGVHYTAGLSVSCRTEDIPPWSEDEWKEYRKLAEEFGDKRRTDEMARRAQLTEVTTHKQSGIYLVVFRTEARRRDYSYDKPVITGIIDTVDEGEAIRLFSEARALHPELDGHSLHKGTFDCVSPLGDEVVGKMVYTGELTTEQLMRMSAGALVIDSEDNIFSVGPAGLRPLGQGPLIPFADVVGALRAWTKEVQAEVRRTRFEELLAR